MKGTYKNLPWHSREVIAQRYPLTDSEKLELAGRMADARAEVVHLENELASIKKDYKERIDMYSGDFSQAAIKYKEGLSDPVDIECDVYQDFEKLEMVYVAVDTGEEVKRRPMEEREKRPTLFSTHAEKTRGAVSQFPKK